MKEKFMAAVIMAITLCACTSKNSDPSNELVMGTHAAYPPYESVDAHGEIIGFDIDVAKAVAAKLGRKLVIQNMSFDALILALKQKKFDIIMGGISITNSRQKEIALVPYQGDPITSFALLFWNTVPGNVMSLSDLKNMGNKTVAVQTGTTMESYLNKVSEVTPKALDGTVELIMDIKHGKAVAALVETHIATAVMLQHPQLKRIDFALPKEDWVLGNGIGILKGNTKLIGEVQSAIQTLKNESAIQQLEQKWFKKNKS